MKKTTLYISLFFLLSSFVQKPNISFEVNEHNFGDVKENDGNCYLIQNKLRLSKGK